MQPHPYLRAFMAGIVVPTIFLLVTMTVYACFRFYLEVPSQFVLAMPSWPLARAIVFPMAIVPNAWGLWNMLYLAMRPRLRLSIGLHGAILPLILIPGGIRIKGRIAPCRPMDSLKRGRIARYSMFHRPHAFGTIAIGNTIARARGHEGIARTN